MADAVIQQESNKKLTGFQLHPENINKNGRPPRGWSWADIIEQEVQEQVTTDKGVTVEVKKAVVKRLVRMALEGDIQAIKEMFDRMDGRPKQQTEHTGPEGKALQIKIIEDDKSE